MDRNRKTSTENNGQEINKLVQITKDSEYDHKRKAALSKSPDHTKMIWVPVPEISPRTWMCLPKGTDPVKAKQEYLKRHEKRGITLH